MGDSVLKWLLMVLNDTVDVLYVVDILLIEINAELGLRITGITFFL